MVRGFTLRRRRVTTAAAVFALALATGCGRDATHVDAESNAPDAYSLPSSVKFTYQWTATPGINLQSPPAIVTRAFIESMSITMQSNMQGGYPGYYNKIDRLKDLHFGTNYPLTEVSGTYYQRLLKLDHTGDAWHAVVCTWENGITYRVGDAYETNNGAGALLVNATSIDLLPPASTEPQTVSSGQGTARFPTNDVFGGWTVPSAKLVAGSDEKRECQALPDNPVPPNLQSTTSQRFDHPLPSLPPTPGWPEKSSNAG